MEPLKWLYHFIFDFTNKEDAGPPEMVRGDRPKVAKLHEEEFNLPSGVA
jgi:hypothetical protein